MLLLHHGAIFGEVRGGHKLLLFFLGACAKLRKATVSFVISVRSSVLLYEYVRMQHLDSQWTDFYEILYLGFF
jgi:hypothetical protein